MSKNIYSNKNKIKVMCMCTQKKDVRELIHKAKGSLKKEDESSCQILQSYIHDAENILPYINGTLDSAQQEIYDRLEAAVGP